MLRPDQHIHWEHLELDKYIMKGKTHTGDFNIHRLELNRRNLRRLREIRERISDAKDFIAFGIRKLSKYSVDRIKRQKRYEFLLLRQKFLDRESQLSGSLDSILRRFAKSPYLDEDPDKKKRLKRRREYLKKQKALEPEIS